MTDAAPAVRQLQYQPVTGHVFAGARRVSNWSVAIVGANGEGAIKIGREGGVRNH